MRMHQSSMLGRAPLDLQSVRSRIGEDRFSLTAWVEDLSDRIDASTERNVWIWAAPRHLLRARAEELLRTPGARDLPLYGVPFAVKDNIDVAGMPTSAGCPDYTYHPSVSAPSVEALLNAGAICLGKVNLDQFATGLVGTRSPWGPCHNVFDPAYVAGGSSSGSGVAVAAGLVSFALGTDTAGSGRVPAALNNVVGLKPTRGLVSTRGVVPACQSLDCVSVFALCVNDAARVREIILGNTAIPPQRAPFGARFRFAVPAALDLAKDEDARLFDEASLSLEGLGGERVELDWKPFQALGDLLYGPFVVERYLAVGDFISEHPRSCLPLTKDIILAAARYTSSDVFRALYELDALRAQCNALLSTVDVLMTPTVPGHARIEDDAREPRAVNDRLGTYTRFANFLGVPVVAIPAGFRRDGLPFGVSLVAPPHADRALDALASRLHAACGAGMGRARDQPPLPIEAAAPSTELVRLAVVGAHLSGLPLHSELLACGARFVRTSRTAPVYRLFALPGTRPEKPGILRVDAEGHAIEIELYDIPFAGLGRLMASVPPPLTIGTVRTAEGELVKGFLCESLGTYGARDISHFGGFRPYLARDDAPAASSGATPER